MTRNKKISTGEQIIKNLLDKHKIKYQQEFSFELCSDKRKLKFDFYLPGYHLLIEFNGPQHYFPQESFGGFITFEDTVRKDKIKNEFIEKYNFSFLRIPYFKANNIRELISNKIREIRSSYPELYFG